MKILLTVTKFQAGFQSRFSVFVQGELQKCKFNSGCDFIWFIITLHYKIRQSLLQNASGFL